MTTPLPCSNHGRADHQCSNQREVKTLFQLLRQFSQQGTAIIFVSHKLHEVRAISTEVAILRDGELVAQAPTSELTEADMARRMVGRELNQLFPELPAAPGAESAPVLEVENVSVPGLLHDISFTLRQGELLGLAGLVGAGRTELAETLYGLHRPSSGTIRLFGRRVRFHSPADAVQAGIAYLSEDRQGAGILTDFALTANITLTSLARYCHPFISRREEQHRAEHFISRLAIKTTSTQTPLRHLSGGNQQKTAIAKGLDHDPKIFLFDEPTRGIDIKAKTDVYRIIHALLGQGLSGIFISSDLEEVIGLCRRVAVMRSGRIAGFWKTTRSRKRKSCTCHWRESIVPWPRPHPAKTNLSIVCVALLLRVDPIWPWRFSCWSALLPARPSATAEPS